MWTVFLTTAILMAPSAEPAHVHAHPAETPAARAAPTPANTPRDENLPPSEQQAKAALEKSPRHGEYVDIKNPAGGAPIRTWIVYPERKDKAGVVILIHEIYGLSDWMRGVADQLARDGFIAVAPDLISGLGPNGGGTDSVQVYLAATRYRHTPKEPAELLSFERAYRLARVRGEWRVMAEARMPSAR